MKLKVLLLGSDERVTLASARSLGAVGAWVGVARLGSESAAEVSRYVRGVYDIGNPFESLRGTKEQLFQLLFSQDFDAIIPLTDPACQLCLSCYKELSGLTKLGMPSLSSFAYAHDKAKLMQLCEDSGVPFPSSILVKDLEDIDLSSVRFPVFAKPIHSCCVVGDQLLSFRPRRVENAEELENVLRFCIGNVPVLVQEEIRGIGVGVYALVKEGLILSSLQQNRLHEPLSGGGGSYRVATELTPQLRDYAELLLKKTKWTGPIMIEFRGDPDSNQWSVMEINGRFWGSLALTNATGLQFPVWWCQMLRGQSLSITQPTLELRHRHLGKDFYWLYQQLRNPQRRKGMLGSYIKEFSHLFSGKEHLDVETLSDPLPAVYYWKTQVMKSLRFFLRPLETLFYWMKYRMQRQKHLKKLAIMMKDAPINLLFICKGNICRSAFAEHYLRQHRGVSTVRSAGTYPLPNRRPPVIAEEAAKEWGVDLSQHRSKTLSQADLYWADAVFVMDLQNYAYVAKKMASLSDTRPILLLGSLTGKGAIPDPFGLPKQKMKEVYRMISEALERMLKLDQIHLSPR